MASKRNGVQNIVKWRDLILATFAVLLAVLPIPSAFIERTYARGLYPLWQASITFVSNAAPFAWLDVFTIASIVLFSARGVRDVARDGVRGVARIGVRAIVWAAVLYIGFLAAWGFNYQRPPMTERLPYDPAGVTPAAATRLAAVSVDHVNALHASAHAEGWVSGGAIDPSLAGAFDRVARDLAAPRGIVAGRPKRSLFDWYFQRAGVAGMTDPFFLETLVASDLLPFERPQVVAHEWAHLAGLANEGEANLAGWLACVRGSAADQYSGWLFMYGEAVRAAPARARAPIAERLQDGPRADLRAIRERTVRNISPRLASAGWRMYNRYLKANRVEAGNASYSEVVRLALGLAIARQ